MRNTAASAQDTAASTQNTAVPERSIRVPVLNAAMERKQSPDGPISRLDEEGLRSSTLEPAKEDVLVRQLLRDEDSITSFDIRKTVLILSAPAVLEMMLQTLVGLADTAMVGRVGNGQSAVAAVSLGNNIVMFALTIFAGIGTGSTALIARSLGARDSRTANRVTAQSLIFGTILALGLSVAGVIYAQEAMVAMGALDHALIYGSDYLRIVSMSAVPTFVMQILTGCLRGAGDTKTPLYLATVTNVLNIIGNYILIFGHLGLPAMGVAGAAISTSVSRTIGAGILFLLLASDRLKLSFRGSGGLTLDFKVIGRIMNVGLPAAIETGFMRGAQLLFARIVATLGTTAVAAHQIALNSESISFMPGWGISMAGAAMVGQSLGAEKPGLAQRFGYESLRLSVIIMGVMGAFFFVTPHVFARLFISDPEVIKLSAGCLRIVAISQPALASVMVLSNILRVAGDTRMMLAITLVGFWAIRLPISYILVMKLGVGLTGAWIGMTIDLFARGILAFIRFKAGKWRMIKV